MKRFVFILSIVCVTITLNACKSKGKQQANQAEESQASMRDNSRTSVDWDGTYTGVIPCASCPGIETRITLNKDNTYQLSWKYQERSNEQFQRSGAFRWTTDGGIIILENLNSNEFPERYRVGENRLFLLDNDGNIITGELAQNYILTKI